LNEGNSVDSKKPLLLCSKLKSIAQIGKPGVFPIACRIALFKQNSKCEPRWEKGSLAMPQAAIS
jgi:hypothetical protein